MIRVKSILFVALLLGILSCEDDTLFKQQSADPVLIEAKNIILKDKDSAEFYANRILNAYKTTKNRDQLILDNAPYLNYYESHINAVLDRINLMTAERKMVPGVYETWLGDLDLKSLSEKNKKIHAAGINLAVIPAIKPVWNLPKTKPENKSLASGNDSVNSFTDKQKNFSINFPQGWQANEVDKEGTEVVIAAPEVGNSPGHSCAISINITRYNKDISNEDFFNSNISLIKRDVSDFKKIKEGELDLHGVKAPYMIFTIGNNGEHMSSLMVFFVDHEKGYIISGNSSVEKFETYKDLYFKIISSFVLVKP
jgi:hypothetical protein